jgi:RimJ/RimL family protein N-acetyltransferase
MSVLPVRTPRLSLRVMRLADAEVLTSYRSLPEIAEYQDWPMPFDLEDARRALGSQDLDDDVSPGGWIQVAIEHEGEVVGDLALGLPHPGIAHLGYTLAPQHHGKGFALEAAGALVDAVFARTEVHRVVATLDPQNHASMRVLEQLGFRYEGTARKSEPIRGDWVDDMRFALLRTDREEWLARPTSCDHVELVEVTHHNLSAVSALETHRFQRRFVAPMERNLAQALVPPEVVPGHLAVPWYRAVVADGEVVGFMMVSMVSDVEPYPYLWRFLIDRRHQRRGVGAKAIAALADHFRAEGHTALMLSWVDAPGGPRRFYERLGFAPTGELDGEEIVARLDL